MKRTIVWGACWALALGMWSCGDAGSRAKVAADAEDTLSRRYVGTIPAADGPGITMDLTLKQPADSMSGEYVLSMTYLEAVDGQDRTYLSLGTWSTERGIPADSAAVYYRLVESSPWADTLNFLYLEDSVMLLGTDLSKPVSKLNYSLIRVAE